MEEKALGGSSNGRGEGCPDELIARRADRSTTLTGSAPAPFVKTASRRSTFVGDDP
jgi:hypothetical protein